MDRSAVQEAGLLECPPFLGAGAGGRYFFQKKELDWERCSILPRATGNLAHLHSLVFTSSKNLKKCHYSVYS